MGDDDDDVPDLVENFDSCCKTESKCASEKKADSVEDSNPLATLKSSLNEIRKKLVVKKCLRTEGDALFRDWRGPQDIANEGQNGSDRIEIAPNSSKSKTSDKENAEK